MPIGLLLLIVVLLLVVLPANAWRRLAARQRLGQTLVGIASIALLLVLLRAGMSWLAITGAVGWTLLRFFGPFLSVRRNQRPPSDGFGMHDEPPGDSRGGDMSRLQALQVLGLEEGATQEAIIQAYRELIKRVHPDRGGSAHLAAQVNRARDVLIAGSTSQ